MSPRLIARSPDLRLLVEEGFEVEIRGPYLLIGHVPFVDPERHVRFGTLVMALALADDATISPTDHTASFSGGTPCDPEGRPLDKMINGGPSDLGHGIAVDHSFSAKSVDGYRDFHHKVTAYVARIAGPASAINPAATAQTFRVIQASDDDSPFLYVDLATQRAGLERYAARLGKMRIAIVGLGGTGSYILDLVAKSSVAEIHLYDGDRFMQHNPFRSPGSTPGRDLRGGPNKAIHWARVYGRMRRGVEAHPQMVDANNVDALRSFDFVFIAVDDGPSRALILDGLTSWGVSCIDVGMGINDVDGRLSGTTRISTGTLKHPVDRARVPTHPAGPENDYRHNIQIAELNALNATLSVIKWKKLAGIYADLECEHFATYTTAVNAIVNEDRD